jgi:circadian clock protein KaiC
MTEPGRVPIGRLATGVPGLDAVLGGGLPEYSFNLIAGDPGSGKTTLAHQIMFANASPERPALYISIVGEPAIKMLRYQQQFGFFELAQVGASIHFLNLGQEVLTGDLGRLMERIVQEVEALGPGIVVVDSFRTAVRTATLPNTREMELQNFTQRLSLHLTGWQATTFMIGEYQSGEMQDNPIFTVSDGILWLTQSVDRNAVVRKLQVLKVRGSAQMPGLHTFRITDAGVQVFPRMFRWEEDRRARQPRRLSTGIAGLDALMDGGIPAGDAVLVAGAAGTGKSVLATQFVAEGVQRGERAVYALFEEHPQSFLGRFARLGFDLEAMIRQGDLALIYLRPLDLSVDEALYAIQEAVQRLGAQRLVIDSLSGFEIALAPTFREDFRESVYRLVGALTAIGVTILMTVETTNSYTELNFSPHAISFLTDDIILLRYVEIEGELRKVLTVGKMRGSRHSGELPNYEVTSHGIEVGASLREYQGIVTGVAEMSPPNRALVYPGLTDQEALVMQTLNTLEEAPLEELGRRTGLRRPDLTRAVSRLLALSYALRADGHDGTVYRPTRIRPAAEP